GGVGNATWTTTGDGVGTWISLTGSGAWASDTGKISETGTGSVNKNPFKYLIILLFILLIAFIIMRVIKYFSRNN
ncbi:MAG: hypothetical protein AAB913_01605, partial [Patescibacteria group bacterium]